MASIDYAPHIEEQLSAYIDGELNPQERREVEEHLNACPRCRAEYEQLKEVAELASDSLRWVRCVSVADRAAYVNGTLDDSRRREVDKHLARCKSCRAEVEQLRQWLIEGGEQPADAPAFAEVELQLAPAALPKPRRKLASYVTIFVPLAAAAAIVVAFASILINKPDSPAIDSVNICATVTRNSDGQTTANVAFGGSHDLHTNDKIQLAVNAGSFQHATLFWINPSGSVHTATISSLKGNAVLPSPDDGWMLGSTIGTDLLLVAFSKEPLGDNAIETAKQALSKTGAPPELPYGSILWLDQNGRWTSKKGVPPEAAQLNVPVATLKKALAPNTVCRGVAFAHE